jgi:hypothetical protein
MCFWICLDMLLRKYLFGSDLIQLGNVDTRFVWMWSISVKEEIIEISSEEEQVPLVPVVPKVRKC